MNDIQIGNKWIGKKHQPLIVAELSGNHNQSLEQALKIIDAAADAGAHAIKLQTYTADTMTLNLNSGDFFIDDPKSLWFGKSLYALYEIAHTPWAWHEALFNRAKERGLLCFSTPFDSTSVDFLEKFNPPCYKIASFENTDVHLINKVIDTGKPVIVSTGMASLEDLQRLNAVFVSRKFSNYILLKCTSAYPSLPSEANLRTIPHLAEMFNCQVGLSDHTMGIGVALAAIALGATLVEKHFCLSRELGGVDSAFSMEPSELKSLVHESKNAWYSLGAVNYGHLSDEENKSKRYRRSVYFVKNLKEGEQITESAIRCIRPGFGLSPRHYDTLLGKKVRRDVQMGSPTAWELISAE